MWIRPRIAQAAIALVAMGCVVAAPAGGQAPRPRITKAPQVAGDPYIGSTLAAVGAEWTPSDASARYRWRRCEADGRRCRSIAEGPSYVATGDDRGHVVEVRLTVTAGGGDDDATSEPTAVITERPPPPQPDPEPVPKPEPEPEPTSAPTPSLPSGAAGLRAPVPLAPPQISGAPAVGSTLRTTGGSWGGSEPMAITHTWLRCRGTDGGCRAIPEADDPEYRVRSGDAGRQLQVRVSAVNEAGSASSLSGRTTTVPAVAALLEPFPILRVIGRFRGSITRLQRVSVRAPVYSSVRVRCRGRLCPLDRAVLPGWMHRLRRLERAFRAGSAIEVRVTAPDRIGKYVRLRFRSGRAPARRDACLAPGRPRPIACPSG